MTVPIVDDWLGVILFFVMVAGAWWRLSHTLNGVAKQQAEGFAALLADHEKAAKENARALNVIMSGQRKILEALAAQQEGHHTGYRSILVQLEKLVGKCERILDRSERGA